MLNLQPHTVFIALCQTQSTATENTKLLHVGSPSSHLHHMFIYVSNIRNTNASTFQVMPYLDKALEHSSERNAHSEIPYHQTGFLLFKWDIALSLSRYRPVPSPFNSPSPMVKELQLPQELTARDTALQESDRKPSSLKLMSAPWNSPQNQHRPQTCTAAS